MKTNPRCILAYDTVQDAAHLMKEQNIGFLPVCDDDGKVQGAVTDRDITIRIVAEGHPPQTTVREAMTSEVVACKADDDVQLAERMMARNHKSRVVVTDDGGKLLGVISLSDIYDREDDPERAARTAKEVVQREIRH